MPTIHAMARVTPTELQRRGFRVLRFWNNELAMNEAGVLETICTALRERAGND